MEGALTSPGGGIKPAPLIVRLKEQRRILAGNLDELDNAIEKLEKIPKFIQPLNH